MTSPALRRKIANARAKAPYELPMARLCTNVILASILDDNSIQDAVQRLKLGVGNNWSLVTALQFMSGRRGEFAADCGTPEEQPRLHLAHLVAKQICSSENLGEVAPPDWVDVERFKSLVAAVKARRLTEPDQ